MSVDLVNAGLGLIPGEKWKSVSPQEADASTPDWQIYHKGKTAVLTIGEKQRVVKFGACTPFESLEELQTYAQFIEQNPDFILIYGRGQDPIITDSITDAQDGKIRYTTQGIGIPEPHTQIAPLERIHSHLFVHQNPWTPVPSEYRFWLGNKSGQQFWALQANPAIYDIVTAAQEQEKDTWRVGKSNVKIGDRLFIWKAKGGDRTSGIVALAEVISEPQVCKPMNLQYFRRGYTEEELQQNRVIVRYVPCANLPLWKEDLPDNLTGLSVAKGVQGNVFRVKPEQWDALMQHVGGWAGDEPLQEEDMSRTEQDTIAKNTILYGPPGTGKTYNTILQAVGIIDGTGPEALSMEDAKPRWDALRSEDRIEFVTFHQSYGYEDFVEGIRPVMTEEAGETPHYEVFEGVLKRIALRALLDALEFAPEQLEAPRHSTFDQVWTALKDEITTVPDKEYSGATTATKFRLQVSDNGNIQMENILNPDTKKQTLGREKAAEIWELYAEGKEEHVNRLLSSGNYPARKIVFERLKQLGVAGKQEVKHPAALSIDAARDYLRKGSQTGYQLNKVNPPRYVLVIDEINRGNISKIFGELITLVEDDKRIGGDVALTLTLPHSRETFGLPSNLYILGTMNTADKSIALVDVALRRRFEFEELLPRFTDETCPYMTPQMRAAIVRLNERIVLRKDRDHQIGHAFFRAVSSPDDFNRVFAKKIIPLLQEYFYGDWESLRYVLGETGENENQPRFIVSLGDNEPGARNRWQWYRDAGKTLDALETLVQNYK